MNQKSHRARSPYLSIGDPGQAEGPALQRPNMMLMDRGPFWTRSLGMSPEAVACPLLDPVLERLGARRMVVGHTPQRFGDISARCDGRLLVADTFMSQARPR